MNLEVVMPPGDSGAMFQMTSEDVNKEISKLVVGQGGTTDGGATGLNSDQTRVMKDEQILIAMRDASGESAVFTEQLLRAIAVINWGEEAAALYCPTFEIDASPSRDRKTDLEVIEKAVAMRLPVPVDEARGAAGLRAPEPGEPTLSASTVVGTDGTPSALPEASATVTITPSDVATIVTVDEARASVGLPPIGGTDGGLTISQYKAKYAATVSTAAAASAGDGVPPKPQAPPPAPGPNMNARGSHDDDAHVCSGCGRAHLRFGGW
jgi:hypothetical protein